MFSINVEFSIYVRSVNVVVITGKYSGELTGYLLVDSSDTSREYVVNNVVHMGYKNPKMNKDTISLNLKPNGYEAEGLVGKCLISPD
ncbi:hypothetical protein J7E73_06765 [Paenibacillus albidus]|uniref:hypothetical protein n=1 Tax=Paenibacillus albidus TaxID=2041023 RepID=UPI001BE51B4E|nr:hypothetical protein [Paenibacillus albidus]MBT2288845.1 hypothetical protein [Paenibacillus albidus]